MRYPDDFDASTFPAGKQIALTRTISIAIMVVFLLILFACGLLLWVQKSVHIHPFLISINQITGQWEIVGHQHGDTKEMTTVRTLQESVVGKFLEYHFFVTDDAVFNANIWAKCERQTACTPDQAGRGSEMCALYCISSEDEHEKFMQDIMPLYQNISANGEMWTLDVKSIELTPISPITSAGGSWQIRATINSSVFGPMKILAYANVMQDAEAYPQTLGYYVNDFNAYRIGQ